MLRGDKSSYTGKQKRQARHIEEGYEERGVCEKEAGRSIRPIIDKWLTRQPLFHPDVDAIRAPEKLEQNAEQGWLQCETS